MAFSLDEVTISSYFCGNMLGLPFVHWLVVLSAIISIAGFYAYLRDTLWGKTTPNRVSWSMWAIAPLVSASAAVAAGADLWPLVRVFLAGFLPLTVFLASFANPQGYWRLTTFDLACGVLSLAALIVWGTVDSPRIAILLAMTGDGFASIPTLRKAWMFPETETGSTYIASVLSVLLVLPSIPKWNVENAAFQLYLLVVGFLIIGAIYRKRLVVSNRAGKRNKTG